MLLYLLSAAFFYLDSIASFFSVGRSCFVESDHSLCSITGVDCIDWFTSSLKNKSQKTTLYWVQLSWVERFLLLCSKLSSCLFIPLCSLLALQRCGITVLCWVCGPQKPRSFSEEMLPTCVCAVDCLAFTFIVINFTLSRSSLKFVQPLLVLTLPSTYPHLAWCRL